MALKSQIVLKKSKGGTLMKPFCIKRIYGGIERNIWLTDQEMQEVCDDVRCQIAKHQIERYLKEENPSWFEERYGKSITAVANDEQLIDKIAEQYADVTEYLNYEDDENIIDALDFVFEVE